MISNWIFVVFNVFIVKFDPKCAFFLVVLAYVIVCDLYDVEKKNALL